MTRFLLALLLVAGHAGSLVYLAAIEHPLTLLWIAHACLGAINLGRNWAQTAEHDSWMTEFESRMRLPVAGALLKEKP